MKNYSLKSKIIISLLITLEIVMIHLMWNSLSSYEMKEEILNNEEVFKSDIIAILVEQSDGTYKEITDKVWPSDGYVYNNKKSGCTDLNGNILDGIMIFNNATKTVKVKTAKTTNCYLYFDMEILPVIDTFYLGGNSNPTYATSATSSIYLTWSDENIVSYCISETDNSTNCIWHNASEKSISSDYTFNSTDGNQIRYAFIKDNEGKISRSKSDTLILDTTAPVITNMADNGNLTANVTVTENLSGVEAVCINNSSTATDSCIWDSVTGTNFNTITQINKTGYYYVHVRDKAGNIGHSENAIYIYMDLNILCSPYTNMSACMTSKYNSLELKAILNISESELGGMFRYQGTSTDVSNNYICFGTSDKDTCTGNTDVYMYRILGVTSDGQLKVIKKEASYSNYWYSESGVTKDWDDSLIYSALNGSSFLNNSTYMKNGWSDKIVLRDWKFGTISSTSSVNQSGVAIYEIENAFTNTINAKIGLMYLHDYYLAYSDTINYWTSTTKGWIHLSNNDSAPPIAREWLMTYHGYGTNTDGTTAYYAWYVTDSGDVGRWGQHYYENSARPVFYITPSVKIIGGKGTSSSPYLIS